ncbi:MAG: hypothetical protein KAY16_06885 [Spirochaetes bacterium]|nr:hypothetical protein [Spirochaetota bacterium]
MTYSIKEIDFETLKKTNSNITDIINEFYEFYLVNKQKIEKNVNDFFTDTEIQPQIDVIIGFQIIDNYNRLLFNIELKILDLKGDKLSFELINIKKITS